MKMSDVISIFHKHSELRKFLLWPAVILILLRFVDAHDFDIIAFQIPKLVLIDHFLIIGRIVLKVWNIVAWMLVIVGAIFHALGIYAFKTESDISYEHTWRTGIYYVYQTSAWQIIVSAIQLLLIPNQLAEYK
jgi:hypothetical protein